jgi:S-adenosylmethionine:tRNA ribosyltransferase-isomerase
MLLGEERQADEQAGQREQQGEPHQVPHETLRARDRTIFQAYPTPLDVSLFDYDLPERLIAQHAAGRGESRLLVLDRRTGRCTHATISDLPAWLTAGDLLVVNDTRVFPARLLGHRLPHGSAPGLSRGGAVECLLLERLDDDRWDALVHPGQKLRVGERMVFEGGGCRLIGEILERRFYGRRVVRLSVESGADRGEERRGVDACVDAIGHVPLPPYIKRADESGDRERYQTVYARARGSVAAPTAGLHFSDGLLAALAARGVERTAVTLHVGYGTFKPVRAERVEEHTVDPEPFEIDERAASAITRARAERRRVVAVGTTTTRALESAVRMGEGAIRAGTGRTDLFIYPGFEFQVVGGLLTNFHLPRSSLLMLVAAFAGREQVLAAYREAVDRGYRFYSYGDAMLVV